MQVIPILTYDKLSNTISNFEMTQNPSYLPEMRFQPDNTKTYRINLSDDTYRLGNGNPVPLTREHNERFRELATKLPTAFDALMKSPYYTRTFLPDVVPISYTSWKSIFHMSIALLFPYTNAEYIAFLYPKYPLSGRHNWLKHMIRQITYLTIGFPNVLTK